ALSLLDRWETSLARKKGLPDVSENGNFSNVRNVKYNGANLEAASFAEWIVPESEVLELDYVGERRPDPSSPVLDEDTFVKFLVALETAKCEDLITVQ
ncbi:unnamed protein product, partial [Polarella glacialis]